jgi:alkylation response protein AidB-like acyl-CoA dehydrogenase
MTTVHSAGRTLDHQHARCSAPATPDNTQIYEGTNQVQRMVMARQLLKR